MMGNGFNGAGFNFWRIEMTEKTIIEINGVKMEVDLRHATIIHQNLKIGSKVKVLDKSSSYSGVQVYAGIIVGFENFPSLPTITVAYIKTGYGTESPLKFAQELRKSRNEQVQ